MSAWPNTGLEIRYPRRATIHLGISSQTFLPRRTRHIHRRTVKTRPVDIGTKDTSGSGCADAVERPIRRSTRKLAIISSVDDPLSSNDHDVTVHDRHCRYVSWCWKAPQTQDRRWRCQRTGGHPAATDDRCSTSRDNSVTSRGGPRGPPSIRTAYSSSAPRGSVVWDGFPAIPFRGADPTRLRFNFGEQLSRDVPMPATDRSPRRPGCSTSAMPRAFRD